MNMKKTKLSLDAFLSNSIYKKQSLKVIGGIGGSGTPPPPLGPIDGGPTGNGGTGSGPIDPHHENDPHIG